MCCEPYLDKKDIIIRGIIIAASKQRVTAASVVFAFHSGGNDFNP